MENRELYPLKISQTLHGYRDGHRLLAHSIALDELSTIEMARMSDLMPKRLALEECYFCAYPLKSINKYVFACTWPAPEMSRPGCVWTHSLIFDYATVAKIDSLRSLLRYFKKPFPAMLFDYGSEILASEDFGIPDLPSNYPVVDFVDEHVLRAAVKFVYYSTVSKIVFPLQQFRFSQAFVPILIWDQMPPRLRRDFVFCTAGSVRSVTPASTVSLVLSDDDSDLTEPDCVDTSDLEYLISDLYRSGRTQLRNFISRYVIDIGDARSGVAKLVSIAADLFKSPIDFALTSVAKKIVEYFPLPIEARILKRELLTGALLDPDGFGLDGQFKLISENLLPIFCASSALTDKDTIHAFLQKYIIKSSKEEFLTRSREVVDICWNAPSGSFGRELIIILLAECPRGALAPMKSRAEVKLSLASLDTRLLSNNEFWASFETEPTFEDWEVLKNLGSMELLASGLLAGKMYTAVRALLLEYPTVLLPVILEYIAGSELEVQREILSIFRAERVQIIRYIADSGKYLAALAALAEDIFYMPYPQVEAMEWIRLFPTSEATTFINPYLAFIIFDLAGSAKKELAVELYILSFHILHLVERRNDLAALTVSERIYQTFARDYNSSFTDVGSRVRRKLCDFYQNYWDFNGFIRTVPNDEVWGMLLGTMVGLWRGREWLDGLANAEKLGQIRLSASQKAMLSILSEKRRKGFWGFGK